MIKYLTEFYFQNINVTEQVVKRKEYKGNDQINPSFKLFITNKIFRVAFGWKLSSLAKKKKNHWSQDVLSEQIASIFFFFFATTSGIYYFDNLFVQSRFF